MAIERLQTTSCCGEAENLMSQVDVKTQMVNDYGDMTQMSSDCHKLTGTAGDWFDDTNNQWL